MSGQTPLLEVRHLRVEFPTRRGTLVAIDDVSFTISAGEVLGVVGESGAGKSMTGAAIIGLLEPPGRIAAGEIRLDGAEIGPVGVGVGIAGGPVDRNGLVLRHGWRGDRNRCNGGHDH
jgi:ABC-type dipeptide/oligopeptide/nickel transport system ATPase component